MRSYASVDLRGALVSGSAAPLGAALSIVPLTTSVQPGSRAYRPLKKFLAAKNAKDAKDAKF